MTPAKCHVQKLGEGDSKARLDTQVLATPFFKLMTLTPLSIPCPHCGSNDVLYSCKPECCFNHVCSKCYTTFEPVTTKVGELKGEIGPVPPDPDPTNPAAPCARCGEWKLFAILDSGSPPGQLLCVSCKAILTLGLSEVAPG